MEYSKVTFHFGIVSVNIYRPDLSKEEKNVRWNGRVNSSIRFLNYAERVERKKRVETEKGISDVPEVKKG